MREIGHVRAHHFCEVGDHRWPPPFKECCIMDIKIVRVAPTCRLHELYNNHVIKGHEVSTAVDLHFLQFLLTSCNLQPSRALWEALFVNQSLECFCLTHANRTKDVTALRSTFASIHMYSIQWISTNSCDI